MVELKNNESFDSLLNRFKRQVADAGIIKDYMKNTEYIPKSLKRKLKREANQKRLMKAKKYIKEDDIL